MVCLTDRFIVGIGSNFDINIHNSSQASEKCLKTKLFEALITNWHSHLCDALPLFSLTLIQLSRYLIVKTLWLFDQSCRDCQFLILLL